MLNNIKGPIINHLLDNLIVAHNSFNIFYNELSFATQLKVVSGNYGFLPSSNEFLICKDYDTGFLTYWCEEVKGVE